MTKSRNFQIDNIKAILIFSVILGHLLELTQGKISNYLVIIIYSFHIPLFVYFSGYLAKNNPNKIINSIIIPYFIIQIISYLFYNYILNIETQFLLVYGYASLWYMISLFFWYLLIPILDYSKKPLITLIILFCLGLLIGYDDSANYVFSISRTIVFLPFFALGYYDKKYDWEQYIKNSFLNTKIFSIFFIVLILLLSYLFKYKINPEWFYGLKSYNSINYNFLIRLIIYVTALGWLIVFKNLVSLKKNIFSYIGKNTLSIYLLHYFFVNILRYTGVLYIGKYPTFNCIIFSIIILFVLSPDFINKIFKNLK